MEGSVVPILDSDEFSISATGSRVPEPWRDEDIHRHMQARTAASEGVVRALLSILGYAEPKLWRNKAVRKNGAGAYIVYDEHSATRPFERIPAAAARIMDIVCWRTPAAQFVLSMLDSDERDRILWMTYPACGDRQPQALLAWNERGIIEPPR